MIYVKWFKTEVNHSGKPARGRGRAAAHAQERRVVFAASHSFRVLANTVKTIKTEWGSLKSETVTKARFHPEELMFSLWAGDFEARLISYFPSGSKTKCQKPGLSWWLVVGVPADRPPSQGQSGSAGPAVLSL